MSRNDYFDVRSNYLAHYGIKGMKWKVHRAMSKLRRKLDTAKYRQYGRDAVRKGEAIARGVYDNTIKRGIKNAHKAYTKYRVNSTLKGMANKSNRVLSGKDFGYNIRKAGENAYKNIHRGITKVRANMIKNKMTGKVKRMGNDITAREVFNAFAKPIHKGLTKARANYTKKSVANKTKRMVKSIRRSKGYR